MQEVKHDDGGPAFPTIDANSRGTLGISMWDYFAAAAISGMSPNDFNCDDIADLAAKTADYMIAERKKRLVTK